MMGKIIWDSYKLELRRSKRGKIPYYHFEIKREAFMVTLHDEDEPKIVYEVFISPNS